MPSEDPLLATFLAEGEKANLNTDFLSDIYDFQR